jgi:mannose-6-phosphate isomerase-like protein (cupin superfamily)
MHLRTEQGPRIARAGLLSLIFGMGPASSLVGQVPPVPARPSAPYVFRSAQAMGNLIRSLQPGPRTADIVRTNQLPFSVSAVSERAAEPVEFEIHDTRDHVILVLDGATRFELGGEVERPRQVSPGEWRAPAAKGNESVMLGKGDLLTIPRGIPHRRVTKDSVTLLMMSVSAASPPNP